ncbi:MAG TPA: glycosyltransferase family 1 protein [Allosphingosinicella sp.]
MERSGDQSFSSAAAIPGSLTDASGLRIALFSGNYNCVRDGANRALNHLSGYLLAHGAAVRVYAPTVARPAFAPVGDLVSIPSFPIPGRREYRIAPRLTKEAKEDIARFRPTHFHLSAPDWLGTSAQHHARTIGVPVVTSLHTRFEKYLVYYHLGFLTGWARRRLHRFYEESDFILVPSQAVAREFAAEGWGGKMGIWTRGVDHALFGPFRRDAEWRRAQGYGEGEEAILLFLGRLVLEKGLDIFADTVAALRRRGLAVRPLVIGEGPAHAHFAARLGDALFLGHIDGPELARAIASADILLNPSATEAFGNVNLEAMASGLAVVSADVPSAATLIENGRTGLLVPASGVEAYADAVERLIRSRETRRALGEAAVKASAAYNWDRVFGPVIDAYRKTARSVRGD